MSMNRKLFSGALGGLTFSAVGMAVSFLQIGILLRHLPLEVAGIWMIFVNLGGYAAFLDMGLTPTLGREISFAAGNPELSEAARDERIGTLIRSCTLIVAGLSLLVLLLGAPFGWLYLRTIVNKTLVSQVKSAWFIFIFAAALNLVGQGWFAGIYGLGQVFSEKMIRSASAVLGLLFLTIAIFFKTGFAGLSVAYLLQSVCAVLMARFVLSRATSDAAKKGKFDLSVIRALVLPSLKYAATLLGGILILQTDNIVIASTLGPERIPNYQAVAKLITALMTLSMMLVMTSMPLASQAFARKDQSAMLELLNRNLRVTLGTVVVMGSFLACFSDRLISVWLGPHHFVGFPVVWIMLAVLLFETHAQAMAAATVSTGRIVFAVPALIAGIVNIIFSVILARRYGLVGVVLGTMIAQVATNHWYVPWYTIRLFRINLLGYARTILLPTALLASAMLLSGAAVRFVTRGFSNPLSSAVGAAVTLVLGTALFSVIMATRQERSAFLRHLRLVGVRLGLQPPMDIFL